MPNVVVIDTMKIIIAELEQDPVDARAEVERVLIDVMAQQRGIQRDIESLIERISAHEGYACDALQAGEEALALEIASRIHRLEQDLAAEERSAVRLADRILDLKTARRKLQHQIRHEDVDRLQLLIDRLDAAAELESGSEWRALDQRMKDAGIGPDADAARKVLERVREGQTKTDAADQA